MGNNKDTGNIERLIVIGLITSTDFCRGVEKFFNPSYLKSLSAKRLGKWAFDYYKKLGAAAETSIEGVYFERLKKERIDKETAEDIESILIGLNDEFTENPTNNEYLIEQTRDYFTERHIQVNNEKIQALLEKGDLEEAKKLALNFELPFTTEKEYDVELSAPGVEYLIEEAFQESAEPLFKMPKQLGDFLNEQLTPGSFLAFLSPEKRGKSWLLLELAVQAVRQGCPVAFFQAGDMTEKQQIRRIAMRLAQKSNKEKYCGEYYEPIRDCVHNQRDTCEKKCRECGFGVFDNKSIDQLRTEVTKKELIEAYEEQPDYKPCWNCLEYRTNQWGAAWIKKIPPSPVLEYEEALKYWKKFFSNGRLFRVATYSNGTLTNKEIRRKLKEWKKIGFEPKTILLDYADLMEDTAVEFRHKQNQIWKGLRAITQEENQPLLITVTQADADSYGKQKMSLKNFSEDKRKYAHVTAMYAMNQSPDGREKAIGVVRFSELLLRDGEFDTNREIFILQNFRKGRAVIGSYF